MTFILCKAAYLKCAAGSLTGISVIDIKAERLRVDRLLPISLIPGGDRRPQTQEKPRPAFRPSGAFSCAVLHQRGVVANRNGAGLLLPTARRGPLRRLGEAHGNVVVHIYRFGRYRGHPDTLASISLARRSCFTPIKSTPTATAVCHSRRSRCARGGGAGCCPRVRNDVLLGSSHIELGIARRFGDET